jgi:hypothetical protein
MAVNKKNVKFIFYYKNQHLDINAIEEFKKQNIQAIDYLNRLDNVPKVFEDQNAFNAVCFICLTIIYIKKIELYKEETVDSKDCATLFVKFFDYFYTIRNELNFHQKNVRFDNFNSQTLDEKQSAIFNILILATNLYAMLSMNFSTQFLTSGGLKCWIELLKDKKFVSKVFDIQINTLNYLLNPINYIILTICGMSRTCEEDKKIWIELDSVNFLLEMSELKQSLKGSSYNSIVNIADDKQLESLTQMKSVKLFIINRLEKTIEDFENGNLNRKPNQMNINGENINCINHCYLDTKENIAWHTLFQLRLIYKLSINKKMRHELYFENNLMKILKVIFFKGNYFEIYFALEIIAQLTFDENISSDLNNNAEFRGIIENLKKQNVNEIKSEDEKEAYGGVKSFIKQIYFNFNRKLINAEQTTNHHQTGHVMISYNSASRPLCLEIKKDVENFGYKVWIDVQDIQGDCLDSMAKAVEGASCILMCVTEKYRQSVNCQAEAQYAFKLKKPIIPIIMQNDYEPQGWLGIIIGVSIYVSIPFMY